MKKLQFLAIASLFVLSSCKKNYNCECVTTPNSGISGTTTTTNRNIMSKKKADASKDCDLSDENSTSFTTACSIK